MTGIKAADIQSLGQMPDSYSDTMRLFTSLTGPRLIALLLLSTLALRWVVGGWGWADLAFVLAGAALWPVLEWTLHRYVLHIKPFRFAGRQWDPDFARRHRAHHKNPARVELILLPAYLHLTVGPALIALAWFATPDRALALSALAGYLAAALNYEWTHLLVHTRVNPRSAYYQRLFRCHRMHHFRNENYWYGFTVTFLDKLLGTGPDPEQTPRSDSVRDLGVTESGEIKT